ncbi:MAG: tRNA dihydrouridine synthase DusB [Candidatus Omnitrophota bacterium]
MSLLEILSLPFPLISAPLAGLSDLSFRLINRQFGCKYAFLEMIHARSLTYENIKTLDLLRTEKADEPLGLQLLGNEAPFLKLAIEVLEKNKYKHDVLDFNAACPIKKITSKGEGAALLKNRRKLSSLVKTLVKHSKVPVTVKMRLGWDNPAKSLDIASTIQDAGAQVVFVHGRTKIQGYSGDIDYPAISKIKKKLNIPVVASGNILNPYLAKKMFVETGCDGILIARGGLGNPWIYPQIEAFLSKGIEIAKPSINEVASIMKKHLELYLDHYGVKRGLWRFRKFFVWYTRGMNNIKQLRCRVMHISSKNDMLAVIEDFKHTASSN